MQEEGNFSELSRGDPMTPKRHNFCLRYMANGQRDRIKTMREAGYNGTDQSLSSLASKILQAPDVMEYITINTKQMVEEAGVEVKSVLADLEWVKKNIRENPSISKQKNKEGEEVWVKRYNYKDFLKAVELEGKYLAMWTDKFEIKSDGHEMLMGIIKKKFDEM